MTEIRRERQDVEILHYGGLRLCVPANMPAHELARRMLRFAGELLTEAVPANGGILGVAYAAIKASTGTVHHMADGDSHYTTLCGRDPQEWVETTSDDVTCGRCKRSAAIRAA